MAIVILTTEVLEQTTGLYEFDIVDEVDVAVPATDLASMTLTYYDLDTLEIINLRNAQNVLNANNVSIDLVGHVIWSLQVEDSILIDTRKELEQHVILFHWVTLNGVVGRHEVQFPVRNLTLVI